jgi:hypothetical protein
MIQYYLDLETQVKAIDEKNLEGGQIQKIYSTAWFISLNIRTPGKSWSLYLGRGGGYEGVWLSEAAPPSPLRRKDNFLEYFRHHLSSCSFIGLELDPHDRIINLTYQKFGNKQSLLLFWKSRKLYFVHHYQEKPEAPFRLLLSWRQKAVLPTEDLPDLYSCFDEIGRNKDLSHESKSKEFIQIPDLLNHELASSQMKKLGQHPNYLQRKKENIEDDLRKAQQWQKLQTILDQGQSLDQFYVLNVEDQKIKFEGELNPYERRNLVFQKIKKLKRGEGILSERLHAVNDLLDGKPKQEDQVISTLPIVKPVWGKEDIPEPTSKKSEKEDFRIFPFEKFQICVGLSSTGNDQLRNKWANKEDHWLHLEEGKSAHVIIKLQSGVILEPYIIDTGASILAHFSHFNADWIPIIFTQVKNLKGVSGAAGMVIYKKEKHLRCQRITTGPWI